MLRPDLGHASRINPDVTGSSGPSRAGRLTAAAPGPDQPPHATRARAWLTTRTLEALLVGVVCAAAVCLFYAEIVFEHRTFLPFGSPGEVMGGAPPWQFSGTIRQDPYRLDAGGSAWQLEPWARTVAASYASGQAPLWNPHQFLGTPLAADAQPGAFDILRLPTLLTSHAWGWDVYYLSQSALCLVLTYVFGRSVGLRLEAALVAALAFTFSGFAFIRGNLHYIEIFHLLPALLWGTEKVVRGSFRGGMTILAVAVALTVLAGMPEASLLVFLYAASYGAFRAVYAAVERRSWRFGLQRNALLAAAWLVGIGLSAPLLVPEVEYLGLSFNIHPAERGLGLVSLPPRALAYIGVPFINGLPTQSLTAFNLFPVDDYSGAAVVLLAIVGGVSARRLGPARSIALFGAASSLIWGAKLFGLPGVQELGRLPLLVQTLIYIWGTPLLSFSLAMLAGAGVHGLASGRVGGREAVLAGGLFVVYLALAAALNWQVLRTADVSQAAARLAIEVGLAAGVCVAVGLSRLRRLAPSLALGVVTLELWALAPHDVYSDRYDSLAQPPYVSWLQQQQAAGPPFRVFSNDGLLYPDYAQAFGLDDLRAVDGLYPGRTWAFVQTFLSPSVTDRYVGGFGHPELPTELFANRWFDFVNARFVLRPADQSPADATLAQVIVAANYPPNDDHHVGRFTLDGQRREVLVERTPGDISYRLRPDAARPSLTFDVGLDPAAPTSAVEFTLSVQSTAQRQVVFQQVLDGAQASDRGWRPASVDLTPFVGQDVVLSFQTRSLTAAVASPGWGDLHLSPLPDQQQFRQVYAGEISIWENTHAAPRALLIGSVQRAATAAEASALMQQPGFDPLAAAVVETGPQTALPSAASDASEPGQAHVVQDGQQRLDLDVDARQASLLVITDSYYPGWSASLDGAPAAILPTDLAFRGVLVPAGRHQVTLTYAPTSFSVGLALAVCALAVLVVLLWRLPAERRSSVSSL